MENLSTAADSDDGDNKLGHVGQLCFLGRFGFQWPLATLEVEITNSP